MPGGFAGTGISTEIFVVCAHKSILSFEKGCKALSVTCGDSSPKGRAKRLHPVRLYVGMRNGAYLYRYAP